MGGFGKVIAVMVLLVFVCIAYTLYTNTNLGQGEACHLALQCKSKVCDSSGVYSLMPGGVAAFIFGGTCSGDMAPGSVTPNNWLACAQNSDCAAGTSGRAACSNVHNIPGQVCCASGRSTGWIDLRSYCTDLPKGTPCVGGLPNSGQQCASGSCNLGTWVCD